MSKGHIAQSCTYQPVLGLSVVLGHGNGQHENLQVGRIEMYTKKKA